MDKKRAKEILMVHACCSFTNIQNNLCLLCHWNDTNDCENTAINEEVIIEAVYEYENIIPFKVYQAILNHEFRIENDINYIAS